MIYAFAHRVRSSSGETSSASGVNAAFHAHGADGEEVALEQERVAEPVRGEVLVEQILVPRGGNFVDSYLDVVGPDAVLRDPARLEQILSAAEHRIARTTGSQVNEAFVESGLGFRLFVSQRIPTPANDEFGALGRYLVILSRRLAAAQPPPPMIIRRRFDGRSYSFTVEDAYDSATDLRVDADVLAELERAHGDFLPLVPNALLPAVFDAEVEIRDEEDRVLWTTAGDASG